MHMSTPPPGTGAGQVDMRLRHEFLIIIRDVIPYMVQYEPEPDGQANITFALSDKDFRGAWATSAETTSKDISFFVDRGGYTFLMKWAETVAIMEFEYLEAHRAFEQMETAADNVA